MRFLFLDDDPHLHAYYTHLARHVPSAKDIVCAGSELEFVKAIDRHKFDIIVCDIHMAPLDGPDILRKYHKQIAGANIIVLSGADNIAEETRIMREEDHLNVVEYVQKPLTPLALLEILGYDPD